MKTIDRIKADPRVSSVEDEGEDGIWIYLKPGFICRTSECHAVHEWSIRRLADSFKSVEPCNCDECRPPLR